MIYPKDFLCQLDESQNKIIHAKVIRLTLDEDPIESIEGQITGGSINVDGASAVRRTCNLTMVSQDVKISEYDWSLHTKMRLYVGLENHIDSRYPDIIWFDQGVYIITQFSIAYNTTSYTISLTGQDKMCLLNGTVGGTFNAQSYDFGTVEQEVEKGVYKKIKLPVKTIIQEAVHTFANEPYHNIIINDLETTGLTMQEYRYDVPMYLIENIEDQEYKQAYIDGKVEVLVVYNGGEINAPLEALGNEEYEQDEIDVDALKAIRNFKFDPLQSEFLESEDFTPSIIRYDEKDCYITKIEYGDTAGFTEGELVYPSDLIASAGGNIAANVLDPIKNFLGEFEYFYNTDGQFIFQKKKTYTQDVWSPIKKYDGETYIEDLRVSDGIVYNFTDSKFFTTINNNPNILNIRNDFSVWGKNSKDLPIHMRCAIDTKPQVYTSIKVEKQELDEYNNINGLNVKGQSSVTYIAAESFSKEDDTTFECDWRELIYRMALDYNKYGHLEDFEYKVAEANPDFYPTGKTGYEQYYIDLEGFWRQLYNPFLTEEKNEKEKLLEDITKEYEIKIEEVNQKQKEIETLKQEMEENSWLEIQERYEKELQSLTDDMFNLLFEVETVKQQIEDIKEEISSELDTYYLTQEYEDTDKYGWARSVFEAPQDLFFWFDFFELSGELSKYAVSSIGIRPKTDSKANPRAIYYKDVPNIIFQTDSNKVGEQTGYRYMNVPGALSLFTKSARGTEAITEMNNLLYNHTYALESTTITSIPIYHLDVNSRVYINDIESGMEGEYIVSKLSFQLTYNGTMSVTATKAAQRIL